MAIEYRIVETITGITIDSGTGLITVDDTIVDSSGSLTVERFNTVTSEVLDTCAGSYEAATIDCVFSLSGAPAGITIDSLTGQITGVENVSYGTYTFDKVCTSGTGSTSCPITVTYEMADTSNVGCQQCLQQHLEETNHITMSDVSQYVAQFLAAGNLPENPSCYNRPVVRIPTCNGVWSFTDWTGDSVIHIEPIDVVVEHNWGEPPDLEAAKQEPVIDVNGRTSSQIPINI